MLRRPRRLVMALYITGAASFVDPVLGVLFVYKSCCPSGNSYLAEMPAHLKFTLLQQTNPSRGRRRSMRNR